MSDDDFHELDAIEGRLAGRLAEVRRKKAEIKKARIEAKEAERAVSDHAVVRYLERHAGVDIEGIRNTLRSLADEGERLARGDYVWHRETGVIMVIGDEGHVITVLSPEQIEKYEGRKLKLGERIPASPHIPVKAKGDVNG